MFGHVSPSPSPVAPNASAEGKRASGRLLRLHRHPVLALAALASVGVGVVHLAVAPEHRSWWPSVVFFVVLGLFQVLWAVACTIRPHSRLLLLGGAAVNAAALATWAVSRTVGMPFGPHRGEAEPMSRADGLAALLGLAVVAAAVGIALDWHPLTRLAAARPALATTAGGTAIAALAVVALTGVSGHAHPASGEHGEHDHGATVATVAESTPAAPSTQATSACKRTTAVRTAALSAKAKKTQAAKQKAAAAKCRAAALAAAGVQPVAPASRRAPAVKAVAPKAAEAHDDSDGHTH
ncbi:MAG: hypothetical protein ACT4QF_01630 [Sporichthyaceae bacterium]|jgi:hypothetical protein